MKEKRCKLAAWATLICASIIVYSFFSNYSLISFISSFKELLIVFSLKEGIEIGLSSLIVFRVFQKLKEQKSLTSSLKETETLLLKETHHRVKNNLMIITGILELKKDLISNTKDRSLFEETQARIHSISLIHEYLYKTTNLQKVDLAEYIRGLAEIVTSLFNYTNINIFLDLDPIMIDTKLSIPIGLIIMENLTNAIRYGLNREENTKIEITLKTICNQKSSFSLIIKDNGPGFPEVIKEGFGTTLVNSLASQIGATVSRYNNTGAVFQLEYIERI